MSKCLKPLKAEPQEMFGGSNASSIGVWMSRDMKQKNLHHTDPNLTLGKRYFLWFVEDLGEFEKGNTAQNWMTWRGIEIDMCVYI